MLAEKRLTTALLPICICPLISSIVSSPLVTNHWVLGLALGSLISMRLLSKYCTRRVPVPLGASTYCSCAAAPGAGPQNHVRLTCPDATSESVRSHRRLKAG